MRSIFPAFAFVLVPVFAALLLMAAGPALADPEGANTTPAKQAIILDDATGAVLFEKNADQRMPTSSMSKVMTMYVVFDAIRQGRLTLETKLPVSEKSWRMQGSKMFIHVGDSVPVEELTRGVIIQSGNDATIALAEGVAGTEESFARIMNEKAAEMGLKSSHFMNASGWPDPNHYSTARDLATLAGHLIHEFPEYYHYYSEKEFTYNNIRQGNRNPLLYRNIGADGVKTGHTEDGGYGLIGSGVRDGRRVIMVLNGLPDSKARAQESARLLEWALSAFENKALFTADAQVVSAPVYLGAADSVPLVPQKDIVVTLPKMAATDKIKVEASYPAPLRAPIKKGDVVGTLKVETPVLGVQEFPLVAGADVAPAGMFKSIAQKAQVMLGARQGVTAPEEPGALENTAPAAGE